MKMTSKGFVIKTCVPLQSVFQSDRVFAAINTIIITQLQVATSKHCAEGDGGLCLFPDEILLAPISNHPIYPPFMGNIQSRSIVK